MAWVHRCDIMDYGTNFEGGGFANTTVKTINLDGLWRITIYIMNDPSSAKFVGTLEGIPTEAWGFAGAPGPMVPVGIPIGGAPFVDGKPILMRGMFKVGLQQTGHIVAVREWIVEQ